MKLFCTEADQEPAPSHKRALQFVMPATGNSCWLNVCVKCGDQAFINEGNFVPPTVTTPKEPSPRWSGQPSSYTVENDCLTAHWLKSAYAGRIMTWIEDSKKGPVPYGHMEHHLLVSHAVLEASNGERILLCLFRCVQTLELRCAEFGTDPNYMQKYFRDKNTYSCKEDAVIPGRLGGHVIEKVNVTFNNHLSLLITLVDHLDCDWDFKGDAVSLTNLHKSED